MIERGYQPERRAGNPPALQAIGLTKHFGPVRAVDGLDLAVAKGEIYGFLGRNGAGKTTTIRMMLGLIRPSAGRVLLFGNDVARRRTEAVRPVGSLVETATAYASLTVRENLEIQRRLTNAPPESLERVLSLFGLRPYVNRRAGQLSLGNKQRLSLARAVLHKPGILILDEPSNALDPAGIVEIRQILRQLRDEDGLAILVSSHILSEISQLADRIGIIHRGRLITEMRPEELASSVLGWEVSVSEARRTAQLLSDRLGLSAIQEGPPGRLLIRDPSIDPALVARLVVEAGIGLSLLCPVEEDLEARFLRLTREEEK